MNSLKHRLPAVFAMAAGSLWAFVGIIHLTSRHQLDGESTVEGAIGHLNLAALALALLLLVPVMLELARYATNDTGAKVAAVGMVALAILCTISNVRGEDPSFFPPVAIVTNLMWFGGSIALAVALKRAGRISPRLAVFLPFTWLLALPGAQIGLTMVAGAYWLTVGYLMYHGALERRALAPATA